MPTTNTTYTGTAKGAGLVGAIKVGGEATTEALSGGIQWNRPYYSNTGTPTVTQEGNRQIINPNVRYESRDPLKGSVFEQGAILGLDPLGIFDVPQLTIDLERLNADELASLTEEQARRAYAAAIDVERQFSPETEQLRREATQGLMGDVRSGGQILDPSVRAALMRDLYAEAEQLQLPELQRSQLYDQAVAQVMADLGLGGQLDAGTRNLVMREAAQRGGQSGFLGGVVGRDIGARDLGLTSMNVRNQRLNQALGVGQAEQAQNIQQQGLKTALNQANVTLKQQQQANRAGLGQFFAGADQQSFANRMGLAQFGQGIERPPGSIDPGSLASAYIADINQRNQIVNQASIAQANIEQGAKESQNALIGQVAGSLMGMFCWVAREVYGAESDEWTEFRFWLISVAPEWLYKWYGKHGEALAGWLRRNDGPIGKAAKFVLRKLMNCAVRKAELSYVN